MPAGRPPKLSRDLISKIESAVAAGLYKETASALHAVDRGTLHAWLKRGAEEKQRVEKLVGQGFTLARITGRERIYVELSDAIERAIANATLRDLSVVDRAAQGGAKIVTITTRTKSYPKLDDDGKPMLDAAGTPIQVVEVVREERTAEALPEWTAAAWKLERRDPKHFGRRTYRELTGADGKDLIPLDAIRAVLANAGDVDEADWEFVTDAAPAGLLGPGADLRDAATPAPDLPEA